MKRGDCIPYIEFLVALHGCVEDDKVEDIKKELKAWLREKLKPDYDSDIDVELASSAGWEDVYGD